MGKGNLETQLQTSRELWNQHNTNKLWLETHLKIVGRSSSVWHH